MADKSPLTLVLLSGLDGTGVLFEPIRPLLAAARPVDVIAYPVDALLGYDALTGFVRDRLPVGPCILLGESFSGPVAIEIAARNPERIAGLILAVSFARRPMPAWLAWGTYWGTYLMPPSQLPRALVSAMLMGGYETPERRATLDRVLASVPLATLTHRVRAALQVDKTAALNTLSCPLLCLSASKDRLIGKRHARLIAAAARHCDAQSIVAPHMLLQTCPDLAAEIIERFCLSVDAARLRTG